MILAVRENLGIPGFTDPFSSLSHLLGAAVFAWLIIPTVRRARSFNRSAAGIASIIIFGLSAVFLLSMSGVYHLLPLGPDELGLLAGGRGVGTLGTPGASSAGSARAVLRRLDHAAIFVLIAGTFTPIHTLCFKGLLRWGVLAFLWFLAVVGVTLKSIFFHGTPPALGLWLYVAMGWFGIVSMVAVAKLAGPRSILPLVAGGVVYTLGALIELLEPPSLIPGVIRAHELFHIAVLGGLALHWRFIWNIIAFPPTTPGPAPLAAHLPELPSTHPEGVLH